MKIIKIKAHTERTYRHTWTTSNMNAEPRGQGRQKKQKYTTEQNRIERLDEELEKKMHLMEGS